MPNIEDLRKTRIEKMEALKGAGNNPFPNSVKRECTIKEALDNFWIWRLTNKTVFLTGRIQSIREHGQIIFFDLKDGGGKIQCFLHHEKMTAFFDIGDFVEVGGAVFKTKQKEKTLRVKKIRIIAKTIRPLPEKWHGLKDVEERYRKRYLDLLMNEKIKENFLTRSRIIGILRNFFNDLGFVEFETPVLQSIPGGATARPFKTRLNALDLDLYLRIAPELYLKRLLVGGFEKVYEIGRNFRNEGMDAQHNPEFTLLEFYTAYNDLDYLRDFFENLFRFLADKLNQNKLILSYENNLIDFSRPFQEKKYGDLIKEFGDLDTAKKTLIQPTFVTGFPKELLPLAKTMENNPAIADAFQIFIGGLELVKAFTELNDPIEQRKRFEEQEKLRADGDKEAQRIDEDFLEAMEYGMPPCVGAGIGIDRLAALLTNSHTLREIILFPTMKNKEQ